MYKEIEDVIIFLINKWQLSSEIEGRLERPMTDEEFEQMIKIKNRLKDSVKSET